MTPSATTEGGELSPKPDDVEQKTSANGKEQRVASSAEQVSASNGKSKKAKSVQQGGKAAEGSKDGKLSGKEAKEAAKAAKIARRAQEKQAQQGQPAVDLAIRSKGEQTKNISTEGPTGASGPPSKTSRIRTSSIGGSGQKSKIQTAQSHAVPITAKPDRENKNVALLDHLYSHPRRTSIAGACKDVHPAVLALGLQMRNYLICGSSARCASMMLVFKRVGPFSYERRVLLTYS